MINFVIGFGVGFFACTVAPVRDWIINGAKRVVAFFKSKTEDSQS